jgi:hypothetical protein
MQLYAYDKPSLEVDITEVGLISIALNAKLSADTLRNPSAVSDWRDSA